MKWVVGIDLTPNFIVEIRIGLVILKEMQACFFDIAHISIRLRKI
jgi:hypothetical protein